jgi:hypothetical protein
MVAFLWEDEAGREGEAYNNIRLSVKAECLLPMDKTPVLSGHALVILLISDG